MYDKELFVNYELDDSRWKQILLALLGGSLALHLFVLLFALFVPSVRDAFYIASVFAGASSQVYIDEDYVLEDIKNATIVDLTNEKLEYPAGYFALANGDAPAPDFAALTNVPQPEVLSYNNGFPNDPAFPPLDFGTQPSPTPFPTPTPYSFPSTASSFPPVNQSPVGGGNLPKLRKGKKRSLPEVPVTEPTETAQAAPTPNQDQTAKAEPSPKATPAASPSPATKSSDVTTSPAGFPINKRPLLNLGNKYKERALVKKDIDLGADFAVNLSGEFDKSGKLTNIKTDPKFNSGDPELINASQELLLALNASGYLQYLQELYKDGGKNVTLSISQNKQQDKVLFVIQADALTQEKANKLQSSLNFWLNIGKQAALESDEGTLLKQTFVTSDNNKVIIKLDMARTIAQDMINRQLNKVKPEAAQPNQTSNVNTPTGR